MKTIHWIILGIVIVLATWFVYQTRDTLPRTSTNIDLNWRFYPEDADGASDPAFDDSGWRFVSLPHDWMIERQVAEGNIAGRPGGYFPGGVAWYRKSMDLTEYRSDGQFYLLFEGVQMNADVYFNGIHLGKQIYGYASFYHDITPYVRRDSLNVIAVRTDCSNLPVDRWYSGGGIYRHVRLIHTNNLHIPIWGTAITSVPEPDGSARMNVALELVNKGKKPNRFEIRYDIVDPAGRIVTEGRSTQYLEAGQESLLKQTFRIDDPLLWSPEEPNLYTVNCYLVDGSRQIDHVMTAHGIRSAAFDPDRGFLLNGEKVMLKGVCLHHDGGPLGAAVPPESWKRRLANLKKLGVNAIRLAHNPHDPDVLDLCDRMGFLVVDEMYDKWERSWHGKDSAVQFTDTWASDLTSFIRRDRNHACVVLWSVGNEVTEQLQDPARGVAWYTDLKDLVNAIDPSRPVTAALHPGYPERGNEIPSSMMHVSPVVSYNYRSDSFNIWHQRYPELVFVASETKPYGMSVKQDYQVIDFSDNSWNYLEEFVAGQFIWVGIDYLGESSGWPYLGWRHGLMETSGFIKPDAWYIGSRYREDPVVKITVKDSLLADSLNRWDSWQNKWAGAPLVDHWNFEYDPGPKEVVVFTNCNRVELHLNDRLLRNLEKENFRDGVIKARVPYEPGTLVARAFFNDENGQEQQVSDTLITADEPYALAMNPDRTEVSSNSREVVHITTKVVDESGILNPQSSHLVNYQLDGPGRIRVIDNGDLTDHTPANATSKEVRKGKQLLILQAGSEPGDLIISASAEGLKSSTVKIKAK